MPTTKKANGTTPRKRGPTLKQRDVAAREQENKIILTMLSRASMAGNSRASLAGQLGQSFGTDRDIYTALGYNKSPTYDNYWNRYERQDIAKALIDKPVRACWRQPPELSEGLDDKGLTPFEEAWIALQRQRKLYTHMSRADRLGGIGRWSVLYLGFDDADNGQPIKPVERAKTLLYVTPYSEANAVINSFVEDRADPRYGLPLLYDITFASSENTSTLSSTVHRSRVIHVAEDALGNDWEGTPQLKAVYNRLEDLERVAGSSAEGYWRGAFPGLGFSKQDGATFTAQTEAALTTEIESYLHGFQRYLRLKGIDIQELSVQVADPSNHVSVLIDLIAASKGIPKRILMGSERGELASTQDAVAWNQRTEERQLEHCEAVIMRPLVNRLVEVKVLPEPKAWDPAKGDSGYTVNWPDLMLPSDQDVANHAKTVAETMKLWLDSGADTIIPPDVFVEDIMKLDEPTIKRLGDDLAKISDQEKADRATAAALDAAAATQAEEEE